MEKKINYKKIWEVTKTVLVWAIVVFSIGMMIFTIVSVNVFDQNERNIFGYKFFVVRSDSMAATDFKAGDIIISKVVDTSTLEEGDIITFISENSDNYGETVTHKIRKVTTDSHGSIAFVTYGTTTNEDDDALATLVVGKYVGKLPNLGTFFVFLKTTPGYIVCILIPFLILILSQGVNTIQLFRKYKKEQMDEMNAEKAKLDKEREESQRMMKELMELKAKLAAAEAEKTATDTPPAEATAQTEEAPDAED